MTNEAADRYPDEKGYDPRRTVSPPFPSDRHLFHTTCPACTQKETAAGQATVSVPAGVPSSEGGGMTLTELVNRHEEILRTSLHVACQPTERCILRSGYEEAVVRAFKKMLP